MSSSEDSFSQLFDSPSNLQGSDGKRYNPKHASKKSGISDGAVLLLQAGGLLLAFGLLVLVAIFG